MLGRLFSDLRYDEPTGTRLDFGALRNLAPQLEQIVERGEKLEISAVRIVGEQNEVGLVEFNFELTRMVDGDVMDAGGKGAMECSTGEFALLLFGIDPETETAG